MYQSFLTVLGAAKVAAAVANATTLSLTNMAIGDGGGNPTTPSPTQTALVREVYRGTLNSLSVDANNPNWLIAEMVVPSASGGWTVREVGVVDSTGTFISIGNFPDVYKPIITEGSTQDLVIRVYIEVLQPGALTLTVDPNAVVATRQWVLSNFSLAVLLPGGTTGEILRKNSNTSGDVAWYDPVAGYNITVTTAEENQVASAGQTAVICSVVTTGGMSVYINGIRLRANQFTIVDATHFTLGTALTAGQFITMVQNEPAAAVEFLQAANNLSEIAAAGTGAQAAARTNLGVASTAATVTAVLQAMYPVGEFYATARAGNPSTLLGFGTWEAYAQGQALVGSKAGDANFGTLGGVGGAISATLSTANLPAHEHDVPSQTVTTTTIGTHSHTQGTLTAAAAGDHVHETDEYQVTDQPGDIYSVRDNSGAGSNSNNTNYYRPWAMGPRYTGDAGTHTHSVTGSTDVGGSHAHNVTIPDQSTGAAGSSTPTPVPTLSPFVVVNVWLRTA